MKWGLKGQRPPNSERALFDHGTARFVDVETLAGDKPFSAISDTTISAMEFAWLAPLKIRALTPGRLYDFTANVRNDEDEAIATLKEGKLDKVRGDSDFAYDWNPDKGVAVASASSDSTGFADSISTVASKDLISKIIEAGRAVGAPRPAVDHALLKYFSMVVADEEMFAAIYELSALQTGGEVKDVRAATPAMMRLGKSELKQQDPRIASYIDATAEFLEDSGVLEVEALPEVSVPLGATNTAAAGGPEAVAEAVNLTVTQRN